MKMNTLFQKKIFLELEKEHFNSLYHIIDGNIKSIAAEQTTTECSTTYFIDERIAQESSLVCILCEKDGLVIEYQRSKRDVTFATPH